MTETETRAHEIRERLNEIAPYEPDGAVTAKGIAKVCAVTGQEAWARMWEKTNRREHGERPSMDDMGLAIANFAACHALLALDACDRAAADATATRIRDIWEDGGGIGEWLYQHLGDDAAEVQQLTDEMASEIAQMAAGEAAK